MNDASRIFGILNITPDSFSDGGKYFNFEAAISQVYDLIRQGVDVIDVGAESTRPGATPVHPQEEINRLKKVIPEIAELAKDAKVKVSLDTRHFEVFELACEYIDYLNDVSGLEDPRMIELAVETKIPVIVMHSLTVPASQAITLPVDEDPIEHICRWMENKLYKLTNYGIPEENIIFDPGIGFGKTANQSFYILKNIDKLKSFGQKILVGHSRKSCLKHFTDIDNGTDLRDFKTAVISAYLARKKIDYIRVHNVGLTKAVISWFDIFNAFES